MISPISYPPNETVPSVNGNTVQQMRETLEEVHRRLTARGDQNLYYVNGLELLSEAENVAYTQDQCHPNGDGIELMGEHFIDRAAPVFG